MFSICEKWYLNNRNGQKSVWSVSFCDSLFLNSNPIRSKNISTTSYMFYPANIHFWICLRRLFRLRPASFFYNSTPKCLYKKLSDQNRVSRYKYTPYAMPYNGNSCDCHYTTIKWLPSFMIQDKLLPVHVLLVL